MGFSTEWIRHGQSGEHLAYRAAPPRATGLPAVLVLQEAWGVDDHIKDLTLRFAQAGYVALAPDLYARNGGRPAPLTDERIGEARRFMDVLGPAAWQDVARRDSELAKLPGEVGTRIRETLGAIFAAIGRPGALDEDLPTLTASASYLRTQDPASRGHAVGAVGFCRGGAHSALLACADPELRAAVIFYGSAPPLDRVPAIRCPVLGFYGGEDARVNAGLPAFTAAMEAAGKRFEPHVYPGVQHAFFNDGRPAYDPAAARDAFARTLDLFRRELA